MNRYTFNVKIGCIIFCFFGPAYFCQGESGNKEISITEKTLLLFLELPIDATDEDIISKLDSDNKIVAMNLIMRRNITDALPKLNGIVEDEKEVLLNRSSAARTLLYFGQREWVKTMKKLCDSCKPKDIPELDAKIHLAGTLAMVGDYSHAETVLEGSVHEKYFIRIMSVRQLAEFTRESSPVSEIASDALVVIAENDPNMPVRSECIFALDKMVQKRSDFKPKLLEAIDANINSADPNLKKLCKEKKLRYGKSNIP